MKAFRNVKYIRSTSPTVDITSKKIDTVSKPTDKYSIIIPAAGQGTRMKSYGVKSLIKLTPKLTVIENQLNIISNTFKNYEVILITGFEACRVMRKTPSNIINIENERYDETNVCRSIGMGLRAATTNRVVIVYGDLVFNQEIFNTTFDKDSFVIVDPSNTMTDNEVGCTIMDGMLKQIMYDLPNKWSQIAFFTGKELEILKEITWNSENERLYGFEVINQIIDQEGEFKAIVPDGAKVNDIDTSKDIPITKKIINP